MQMGFFHQLLILLWKNWSIKKRHLWVTVFELATPVVLFVILVTLRMKEPIKKIHGTNYNPRPLPSSGMLAVLQEFCPHIDGRDDYGYPLHHNTKVEPFLEQLHRAWENSSAVDIGMNVSETLTRFNQTWTNMTRDSDQLNQIFSNRSSNSLRLYNVLNNPKQFRNYLMHNVSMSHADASSILNSTVNMKEVLRMLNAYPFAVMPHLRRKRSTGGVNVLNYPLLPKEHTRNLMKLTKKGEAPNIDSFSSASQAYDAPALLPLVSVALHGFPGLHSTNLSPAAKMQQQAKLNAVEAILFSPTGLRYMVCDSQNDVLGNHDANNSSHMIVFNKKRRFVSENESQTRHASDATISLKSKMCDSENNAYFSPLSKELLSQLNNTAILEDLAKASDVDTTAADENYAKNLQSVLRDLTELEKLSKYIHSLVEIAKIIPDGSCDSFNNAQPTVNTTAMPHFSAPTYTNTSDAFKSITAMPQKGTNAEHVTDVPLTDETKKSSKRDYLALWASMQPLLCGTPRHSESHGKTNASNFHLTGDQKRHLGILIHVLVSNPKILYAPNNTQVVRIIKNANTSFAIIDNITKAGDTWRNISKNIREALADPAVASTFTSIVKLQETHKQHPELVNNLTAGQPNLQKFLSNNETLPNRTQLYDQLDKIDNAACGWKKFVSGISINWFKGFNNEDDAVAYATEEAFHDNASVFATVIFQVDENGDLPPHVTYKIRQNASFTQPTASIRLSYWRPDPFAWDFRYYTFGFVWIQDLIERSIMSDIIGHDVVSPGVYLHEMPFPCFKFDAFAMNLEHIMPLAMIISWVYTVAMFVQHIVYEKEQRLKEVMKIMGLSNGVHWLAWFISIFLQLEITVTVISVLLKFGKTAILPNSNFFIIWLFFSVYAAATITFCFLVSVLFSKAKVASACSGIIYFMSYLPFAYMSIQEYVLHQSIPALVKSAASLLSTTAFGLGAKYFALYELSGYGIQWDNMATTPVEGDSFSLLQALYMLIVDIFIYAFLTWYIEAVFPGQYGLPRPWYFLFTRSYWTGHGGTEVDSCTPRKWWMYLTQPGYRSLAEEDQAVAMDVQSDADIEPAPSHLQLGVKIEKLTKVYKRGGKKAVDKLSINFYEDQITSFLGHNGAGKTTTMSILTGLIPPTSGTAYIYGSDIRTDMLTIRKSLGMCPQHNALFDALTVQEHLWFYARLKGASSTSILKDMDKFLEDVGLLDKRHSKVNTLSGGMKRKLSVAIAFVGGSRTVILDEPTAGVDPYARRAIWDLIIKYKEGRTILLSTHHMDEADLLGDRIAIISNGKLQCCGSSLFLKSTYGDGYNLTLLKKLSTQDSGDLQPGEGSSSSEDKNKVTKFVHRHVPTALVTTNSSNQISFNLPFEAAKKGCFHQLFDDLPSNMDNLEISGYGLTDTTLEEVFLKVDSMTRWDSEDSSQDEMKKYLPTPLRTSQKRNSTTQDDPQQLMNDQLSDDDDIPLIDIEPSCSSNSNCEDVSTGDDASSKASTSARRNSDATAIALEWLNSSPTTSEHTLSEPSAGSQEQTSSDDALLLDFAFGDSSFSAPSNSLNEENQRHDCQASGEEAYTNNSDDDVAPLDFSEDTEGCGSYKLSPLLHNWRILTSLLTKRFHYARRSRKAVFYQIMLPALFVCIAMSVALSLPTPGDPPPLILSPSQYHNMTQPKGNFIPYSDQRAVFPIPPREECSSCEFLDADAGKIIDTFSLPSGVGATCVLKSDSSFGIDLVETINSTASGDMKLVMKYFDPLCRSSFTRGIPLSRFVPPVASDADVDSNLTTSLLKDVPCACSPEGNTYICRSGYGKYPVTKTVVTGDKLIDITGKEPIMPYLMYTTNHYRLHRYGAFSFGEVRKSVKQTFPGWPSPLRKIAVREAAQVYYNHKGFHSMPTYLNVLNNALLRANLPPEKGKASAYGITVINHPMNMTARALSLDFLLSGTDVIIAIFIIVAMSFIPASFLVFLVAEKQSRAKHLQFISGTGPVTYWLANYLWDMLNYLFPAALCIMILQIFNLPAYTRGENAYAVVALFLLYGWSMTPMMYPASFYFTVPSTAYVCLIVLNLFVGITTVVTTFMVSMFREDKRLVEIEKKLQTAFLIFPNYNLGKGLMDLSYYEYMNDYYRKIGEEDMIHHPFEWDIITRQLVAMATEGVVGFLLTLLFEVRFFTRFGRKHKKPTEMHPTVTIDDVDVAIERHRVEELRGRNDKDNLIMVDNITKVYDKHKGTTVAVNGVSFSVGKGECFGLLGVNGAGKTTTFHAITGVGEVTSGSIRVAGHLITGGRSHERLQAQQSTGYCPQFDALFNELTPVEHLLLYARLRGVPAKDEKRVVAWAINKLDLAHHKNKPARDLSGGNRRKLSVAIALVGYPPVILLDEPTAGMDPGARRFLWDLILDVTKSGRAVLLTTHSMEECEVLCNRIAIMVNGRFECFGPTQHLKNRFGDGYTVSIRSTQPSRFVSVFQQEFSTAVLKEQHYHKAVFQLSFAQDDRSPASLAQVFKMLEEKRDELKIEDYSVSQTTLDDVFINFAKNQRCTTVERETLTSKWKRRFKNKRFISRARQSPRLQRNIPDVNDRNLYLRGSPNLTESTTTNADEDDLNSDDQPLYNFNQDMLLSFLDSSC